MKRFLSFLFAFIFIFSTASATNNSFVKRYSLISKYNISASYFGLEELGDYECVTVYTEDDTFCYNLKTYEILFVFDESDNLTGVLVRTNRENAPSDFFLSCMSVISAFSGVDISAFGMLLMQFSYVKTGKENDPMYVSKGTFMFTSDDHYKYHFIFMPL